MKIKGFDKDLKCRGMQFEIGKVYDTGAKESEISLCSDTVFHYCDCIQNVHCYYSCNSDNRFCEIEVLGKEVSDGEKCGSNRIKIVREIVGNELDDLLGKTNGNTGLFNTGDCNTGHRNTGNCNTGNRNTGNCNTGDRNTGNRNTGHRNTGHRNTGSWNTGDWNICNGSTGFFCTEEDRSVRIFNKPSGMSANEFRNSRYAYALYSSPFMLTQWIEYTESEKDTEEKKITGGYLKELTFKEACRLWWGKMSAENKAIVKQIPNFDADIFQEITGIDVRMEALKDGKGD